VALKAHNLTIPVIMLGRKGQEAAIIQTFRLGAADYLLWPVREPEVIASVERLLKQAQERRERDRLARQVQQANAELQMRVRELTTIFSLGKAVTTVMDQAALFEKILDGAISITQADLGWFVLAEEKSKGFVLAAHRGLPRTAQAQGAQLLDDGISSLVSMSGEALSIFGEPLRRFRVSSLGQSALIAPIKVQKQTIGLLVMMRAAPAEMAAVLTGDPADPLAAERRLLGLNHPQVGQRMLEKWHLPIYGFLAGSSIGPALLLMAMTPLLKKWMHGRA